MAGIKEMKRRPDAELDRLLMAVRHNLGTQKKTKLKSALGKRAKSTLLDDTMAATHAERLLDRFKKRWGGLNKNQEKARLRFLTVLGSLAVMDEDAIERRVKDMEWKLLRALKCEAGNLEIIGAFEIEVVNLKVLKDIASVDYENEQRKLNVLSAIMADIPRSLFGKQSSSGDSFALVHLHAMVDLGADGEAKHTRVVDALQASFQGKWRVELKHTFEDKALVRSLKDIAGYLTKGGNEALRYNARFGRDKKVSDELDHQIWRAGGFGDKQRPKGDPEDASVEDSRSLSFGEIKVLGEAIDKLMARNGRRDGYLFTFGTRQRG